MNEASLTHGKQGTGHYSPAVLHGGALYISSQLPVCPQTGQVPEGGIAPEMEQVLKNREAARQRKRGFERGQHALPKRCWAKSKK